MYRRARQAIIQLSASESVLKDHPALDSKDLQLNRDITEKNHFYQRNDTLPWFWVAGDQNQSNMTDWTKEGKIFIISYKCN